MSNNAILDAKVFAETKLLTVIPALPIAFEGVSFEPPSGMYLRTQIVISPPTDPVLNTGYYRENIEFQVFVTAPLDSGTGTVIYNCFNNPRCIQKRYKCLSKRYALFNTQYTSDWRCSSYRG